ncbi:putative F-box protein At1g49610 [Salvia miltiorrhiza]|uniref:putative F-box protein At1g49610 n=1 Tax=Salvia miltiorrhiza TaxID=226208 RepID=UPI0025ABD681|nr:putative F-box protein At1g49610 [Salvia miltiorrhiza]
MKKSKRSKAEDRLSELPDSVIFQILWLLPMTDVVRTIILSKRWRNLWTTTPFLNFDNEAMSINDNDNDDRLLKFVNRALLCWNGIRVLKFKFVSRQQLYDSTYSDINLWVSFAMRNRVEDLYLNVYCESVSGMDGGKNDVYWVPQFLFSCPSLKELTLIDCNIDISGDVQWNQLKSLRIEGFRVTAHVIDQILIGTPQLTVFILRFADVGESLSIQSSSLKELSIDKYFLTYEDLWTFSELRIWTPNLETLEIKGIPYSKCMLIDVLSLTRATIGLSGLEHCDQDDALLRGIKFEDGLFSGNDFQGNTLSQIITTIQHVENVKLLKCCIKVLGVLKRKCMHSSFPNVKSLELSCCFNDYEQIVNHLEIFPQLERLVLEGVRRDDYKDKESLKFEANLPNSFLMQLRTIEVTWFNGYSMFPLIEILLKYASKLERMVFRVEKSIFAPSPLSSLLLASQTLLRMSRSSPNCKIDFYDCRNARDS